MNASEIKALAENVIEHDSAEYAYFRCDRCATIARAYLQLLEAGDKMAHILFHQYPCDAVSEWIAAKEGK